MRAPARFLSLAESFRNAYKEMEDETLRELGVDLRDPNPDWEALTQQLAEEGNLFLVFDGSGSDVEFVIGDENRELRACFIVTDPIPFERPLTPEDTFFVARGGFADWTVREYDDVVLETILALSEAPEEEAGEEEED